MMLRGLCFKNTRIRIVRLVDFIDECLHFVEIDRKSTRLNSSHSQISYAVFCLKTKKKGQFSRIVPMLEPGSTLTTPRQYLDFVITEFGIVNLQGKTQRQRAESLISIAHPDFRPELMKQAKKLFWP